MTVAAAFGRCWTDLETERPLILIRRTRRSFTRWAKASTAWRDPQTAEIRSLTFPGDCPWAWAKRTAARNTTPTFRFIPRRRRRFWLRRTVRLREVAARFSRQRILSHRVIGPRCSRRQREVLCAPR